MKAQEKNKVALQKSLTPWPHEPACPISLHNFLLHFPSKTPIFTSHLLVQNLYCSPLPWELLRFSNTLLTLVTLLSHFRDLAKKGLTFHLRHDMKNNLKRISDTQTDTQTGKHECLQTWTPVVFPSV